LPRSPRSTNFAKLADSIASHLSIKISEKQELLETASRPAAGKGLGSWKRDLGPAGGKAHPLRVKRQMEKTQREYYLNEQMKAIQKELGDGEDGRDEMAELEERIKTKLTKEAREKARRRVQEAQADEPDVGEATVVRNYLDWLLSIPWGKKSQGQE
jgi:ATP-dependent Lon protease